MSDENIPPQKKDKKKKKKSFLDKMSKVFGGRKKIKSSDNSSSSTDSNYYCQSSDFDGSLSSSSRNTSARNSPAKVTDKVLEEQQLLRNVEDSNKIITNNTLQNNSSITVSSGELSKVNVDDENFEGKERESSDQDADDLRLLTGGGDDNLSRRGFDRNLEAKKKFMEKKLSKIISSTSSLEEKNKLGMPSKEDITPEKMLKQIDPRNKNMSEVTKKFMKKETKINCDDESSDSDESDSTTYTSEDENIDLIESEIIEKNIKDLYFTTGKFITYFFLEMERKWYNPKEEIYSYIKYHNKDGSLSTKGIKKLYNLL